MKLPDSEPNEKYTPKGEYQFRDSADYWIKIRKPVLYEIYNSKDYQPILNWAMDDLFLISLKNWDKYRLWTTVPWRFEAATAVAWLPWLNGTEFQDWFLIQHKFILPKATLLVRPNMRRNGFEIQLKTASGLIWTTEGEFYARSNILPYYE